MPDEHVLMTSAGERLPNKRGQKIAVLSRPQLASVGSDGGVVRMTGGSLFLEPLNGRCSALERGQTGVFIQHEMR